MTSLVSDFLINPVIRQARRFSAGFANDPEPASPIRGIGPAPHEGADEAVSETEDDAAHPLVGRLEALVAAAPDSSASGAALGADMDSSSGARVGDGPTIRRSTSDIATNPAPPTLPLVPPWTIYPISTGLPEDDGRSELRKRILAIQARDISSFDKARLRHQLFMESHTQSQAAPRPTLLPRAYSEIVPSEQPAAPGALESLKFWNALRDSSSTTPDFALTDEDVKPTFVPPPGLYGIGPAMDADDVPFRPLGCEHYRRNVKLQCAECERWYTCRFCHDAAESHTLPRKSTKYMLCMLCGTAQKASDTCAKCAEPAARYYCAVCKLWQDDPNKSVYHCHDCGICRIGKGLGKDFYHCKRCIACIAIETQMTHKCIERSTDCDCPICGDYMFTSPKAVIFMKCGHSIHEKCWNEYLVTSYKCPICNKSTVNMETQFRNLDMAIATQPMPPEFDNCRAVVLCNDCCAKSSTLYHWLGLRCAVCNSYNTAQLRLYIEGGGDPSALAPAITGRPHTHAFQAAAPSSSSSADPGPATTMAGPSSSRARPSSLPRSGALLGPRDDGPSSSSSAFSPLRLPERLARSVSPIRDFGPHNASPSSAFAPPDLAAAQGGHLLHDEEAEESDEEDDVIDFWGRDEARNITSAGSQSDSEDERDSGDCDDDDLEDDDDDDDEEEEEEISLIGHR